MMAVDNLVADEKHVDSPLAAILSGHDINPEIALAYINSSDNASALWSRVLSMMEDSEIDATEVVRLLRWCVRSKCLCDNVTVRVAHLRILHELECYDEFHDQCCQMTCCLATQVVELMCSQREKCLRLASEIVLLQNVINPTRFCCTQRLLRLWLSVLQYEELSVDRVSENVNKMLEMVESPKHLVVFLQVLAEQFGSKLLSLCTSLSRTVLQQLRQLLNVDTTFAGSTRLRSDIIDVLDVLQRLYSDDYDITQSCLHSAQHLSWSKKRVAELDCCRPGVSEALTKGAVDRDQYYALLDTISSLRDVTIAPPDTVEPRPLERNILDPERKLSEPENYDTLSRHTVPGTEITRSSLTATGEDAFQAQTSAEKCTAPTDSATEVLWKDGDIEVRLDDVSNKSSHSDTDADDTNKLPYLVEKEEKKTVAVETVATPKAGSLKQKLLRVSGECYVRVSETEGLNAHWKMKTGKDVEKSETKRDSRRGGSSARDERRAADDQKLKTSDDTRSESKKSEKLETGLESHGAERRHPKLKLKIANLQQRAEKSVKVEEKTEPEKDSSDEKVMESGGESRPRIHFKRSLLERERDRQRNSPVVKGSKVPTFTVVKSENVSSGKANKGLDKVGTGKAEKNSENVGKVDKGSRKTGKVLEKVDAGMCPEKENSLEKAGGIETSGSEKKLQTGRGVEYIDDDASRLEKLKIVEEEEVKKNVENESKETELKSDSDDDCVLVTQVVLKTYERSHRMKVKQEKSTAGSGSVSGTESCSSQGKTQQVPRRKRSRQSADHGDSCSNSLSVDDSENFQVTTGNSKEELRKPTRGNAHRASSVDDSGTDDLSQISVKDEDDDIPRCTTEEVFRKIATESGRKSQICEYCKTELRTRTQIVSHADGKCQKASTPREKNAPHSSVAKQRRVSSDVEAGGSAKSGKRRSTTDVPLDVECRVAEAVDSSGGKDARVKNCVIEITPLNRKVSEDDERKLEDLEDLKIDTDSDDMLKVDEGKPDEDNDARATEVNDVDEIKPAEDDGVRAEGDEGTKAEMECVCDGCGEVVPDCSWLTEHIVTCPGRTGVCEEMAPEAFQPATSTWSESTTTVTEQQHPEAVLGHDTQYEPAAVPAEGGTQPVEVDAASLLQLLCSVESSLLQTENVTVVANGNALADNDGVKMEGHDIAKDAAETAAIHVENGEQAALENGLHLGRIVNHDGVDMYEFVEYRCSACPVTFADETAAMKHTTGSGVHGVSAVEPVNIYCCVQCNMRYHDQRLMWFHVTYICQQQHSEHPTTVVQTDDLYNCVFCTKTFLTIEYLNRHLRLRHAAEITTAAESSNLGLTNELLGDWTNAAVAETVAPQPVPIRSTSSSRRKSAAAARQQQTLLDLACSMVLDGDVGSSGTEAAKNPPTSLPIRRTAKGIVYKNVFMQCIVSYLCSNCGMDLSMKSAKREHRAAAPLSCFDEGPGGRRLFTYVRHYSYLCPYCGDRTATQKACRAHQLNTCLPRMGVKTDELNHKQLLCPFCQRKYFNVITLKGHMTLVHQIGRAESAALVASMGGMLSDDLVSGIVPEVESTNDDGSPAKRSRSGEDGQSENSTSKGPDGDLSTGAVDSASHSHDSQFATVDSSINFFSSTTEGSASAGLFEEVREAASGQMSGAGSALRISAPSANRRKSATSSWRRPKHKLGIPLVRKKVVRRKP